MYDPQTMLDYHHKHYRELMAEAQRARLAASVRAAQPQTKFFYYDALAAFGRKLCNWGEQLQARYDPVEYSMAGDTST